ncbi:MAG: SDR family NAD(P)-dependent oxidoreductase [Ktedonobacterales bacterium]|nr:SDR family NAD(P)-dependent oxidoreductase [Ktedonobacterales bacterium]
MATPEGSPDLRGKVALVTGASSGIGEALARALAGQGARVAIAARRGERIHALADELTATGAEVLAVPTDVTDESAVQSLVAQTVARFGGLDILIPNAGFGYRAPIVEGDTARWKAMLDTNVYGVLLSLHYGVPHILARGRGDVILLGSVAGRTVTTGGAAYSASKSAVRAISEALRQEMSRKNVRVTLLEPGVVASEFQAVADYPPGFIDNWLGGTPPLLPVDIASAVLAVLALPPHVSLNEILLRPTGQTNP